MTSRNCISLIAAALGLLAAATASQAQTTVTTNPVGFVTYNCLGSSDTFVNVPMTRTPAFVGTVASVSGSNITLSGTPGFTANQFVYVSGTQSNTYYLMVGGSSSRGGMYYTVTANGTNQVTCNLNGDTTSAVAAALPAGTYVSIIPYDTFGTLFPGGQGVIGSSSFSASNWQSEILLPNVTTAGKDLVASKTYFYYTGAIGKGPGWRNIKYLTTLANDDILPPDSYFIVRQIASTSSTLTFVGNVVMNTLLTPIGTLAANTDQDNSIGLLLSATTSLTGAQLYESGAFLGTSSFSASKWNDTVLVYDNTDVKHDKVPKYTYLYYTGSNPGWREIKSLTTIANNQIVFGNPNYGVVIRKKATSSPLSSLWQFKPSYVP